MFKSCKQCSAQFEITQDDLSFYDKISPIFNGKKYQIPSPSLCPDCRQQRRLAFRNERKLYHRKCDLTGKQIISIYSPDKPYKVYDQKEWWSDKWNPLDYGRNFDFNRGFFEQFNELKLNVPLLPIFASKNENSDYTNGTAYNKDCYLIFVSDHNDSCYYSHNIFECNNCVDCLGTVKSQFCYQCSGCYNCFNSIYLKDCSDCSDCVFSIDCKNCSDCFLCVGLINKKYCIANKQYTKEEYFLKIKEFNFSNSNHINKAFELLNKQNIKIPHIFIHGIQNDRVTGDYINNCSNSPDIYDSNYLQDCKNIIYGNNAKDSQDGYVAVDNTELCYDFVSSINQQKCLFTYSCWENNNLIYCDLCQNSSNLFGCIGLRNAQYCILNKQYTKEEYEKLVPKIIEHMINWKRKGERGNEQGSTSSLRGANEMSDVAIHTQDKLESSTWIASSLHSSQGHEQGEWGEFFPSSISPFGYNETVAQEYFPLTKEEAIKKGFKWKDEEIKQNNYLGPKVEIPDDIKDVDDSICDKILICEVTGKPYKLIPHELAFYKKMGLPIPRKCPDQRHKERMLLRNPRKLFDRKCDKCGIDMKTTYGLERKEIVYCEECYNKELL